MSEILVMNVSMQIEMNDQIAIRKSNSGKSADMEEQFH